MTDFKEGDKAIGIKHHDGVEVTIVSTPATSGGHYIYAKLPDGFTALFKPSELKLVTPKFKVGDWVKVHGRHDKWDGTVGTVHEVGARTFGGYGHLYTILRNDKAVGEDYTVRFFEGALEATEAPKQDFKVGDRVAPKQSAVSEHKGEAGVVIAVTPKSPWPFKVHFSDDETELLRADELKLVKQEFAKGGLIPKQDFGPINLYNYAEFDAKLTAKVLGQFKDKPAPLKIYLAGPMSGIEHYNFPAFFTAARKLRAAGHEVFNPAENDMATGFNALGMEGHEAAEHGFSLREALKADLTWICEHADALVLLEGWERSKGVRAEMALAEALGLPKYEMERLPAEVAK